MGRHELVVGMTLALALGVAACGGSGQPGTSGFVATSAPSTSSSANPTKVAAIVRQACSTTSPSIVTNAIPNAQPSYKPSNPVGPSCAWLAIDDTVTRHALAQAVTSGSFDNWVRLYPHSLDEHTTVAGYPAVRGIVAKGCTVIVNVEGNALEVDLVGVPDPGCATTTRLTVALLGSRE